MHRLRLDFKDRDCRKEIFGDIEILSWKGLFKQDKIIIPFLDRLKNATSVLVILDSNGVLASIIKLLYPGLSITSWNYDDYVLGLARRIASFNKVEGIRFISSPNIPDEDFDYIIYPAKKEGVAELAHEMIIQVNKHLRHKGILFLSVNTSGDAFYEKQIKSVFGSLTIAAKTRGALFYLSKKHKTDDINKAEPRIWELPFSFYGEDFLFKTRVGIFSHKEIDEGSLALLEVLKKLKTDNGLDPSSIIDIGTGYGILGITAARLFPKSLVLLVDSNTRAILMAGDNIKSNEGTELPSETNTERIKTLLSYDSKEISSYSLQSFGCEEFDLVLVNPPYFGNFRIAKRMLITAKSILKKDGNLLMVTKEEIEHKRIAEEIFGYASVIKRRGYSIFRCTKTD